MKNIQNNFNVIVLSLVLAAATTACKKYEEGPAFSLRSKKERVANTWKAERITENGQDKTNNDLKITFSKGGSYSNTVGGLLGAGVTGTWTFSSDNEQIQTVVNIASFQQVRNWQILKLEEKSLWLREENTEYRLIPD